MAAPINDNFADAIQVDILTIGASFIDSVGSDQEATTEAGEPVSAAVGGYYSTWWKYTPAHSGPVKITKNSGGTTNRIFVTAYTGALGSLSEVYTPSRLLNEYEFDAVGGTTYYIRHSRYSSSYYGDAGIIVEGETTVPSRPPGKPALTLIPEDNTLTMKWAKGYLVTWEVKINGVISAADSAGEHLFAGLTIGNTYTVGVRGTNAFGTGDWSERTITLPNMIVWDNFDRANSTSVVGAGAVGPAPLSRVGTWGISANQLYPSAVSSSNAIVTWECGTANVDIRATRNVPTDSGGFVFGYKSATDYWYVYFNGASGNGYISRVKGTTIIVLAHIVGGPDIIGQQFRFVHHDGVIQAWAGTSLLVEMELPPDDTPGTSHGIRATATSHRWDDLTIRESTAINLEKDDTAMVTQYRAALEFEPVVIESFLYKGRDTKAQDQAGVG